MYRELVKNGMMVIVGDQIRITQTIGDKTQVRAKFTIQRRHDAIFDHSPVVLGNCCNVLS